MIEITYNENKIKTQPITVFELFKDRRNEYHRRKAFQFQRFAVFHGKTYRYGAQSRTRQERRDLYLFRRGDERNRY